MLTWVLAIAALAAGVTGAWSPCGFSMVETLAPAGYAGRLRTTLVACATFTVGALVGGVITFGGLGLLGQWLGAGGTGAVAVAAVVAVAAAIGEARGLRIVPQVRRQVPERWRREWPLPLWSAAYGAGLGLGVLTHQTVATFWVVCAAVVWLADPVAGAAVLAAFGAGRALAAAIRPSGVERLLALRPRLLRLNAAVLLALALLAAVPAVAGARPVSLNLGPGSQDDPSFSNGVLAFTQRGPAAGVVVAPPGGPRFTVSGATGAALGERFLAYQDAGGIAVVEWATGTLIARVDVPGADRPAIEWPWLAYRRPLPTGARALVLTNLETGMERVVTVVRRGDDLSRPALGAGRLAWAATTSRLSVVRMLRVPWGRAEVVARSRILQLGAPALSTRSVGWVEREASGSRAVARPLAGGRPQTILRLPGAGRALVGLTLEGRGAWASYWDIRRGFTRILQTGY